MADYAKKVRNEKGVEPHLIHSGFTLLEMVVSFGIFSTLIVASFGAMLAVNNAQTKVRNIQNVQDNLRFALEEMSREMRLGKDFCFGGCAAGEMTFRRWDPVGKQYEGVGYCLDGNSKTIKEFRPPVNCAGGSSLTGADVAVDALAFRVTGEAPSDNIQPRITIAVTAHSLDTKLGASFNLQTTVTPRLRGQ